MRLVILCFVVGLSIISCCNHNKNNYIRVRQQNCLDSLVYISFIKKENEIVRGIISIKNKFLLKNSCSKKANVNFYYFRDGDTITFPSRAYFIRRENPNYYNKNGKINGIELGFLGNKEIYYFIWNEIDKINLTNEYYKSLEQYIAVAKPLVASNKRGQLFEDKNTLIYEEPFSEFKRKNPELLEFLTKGDSIELEVISPVKQRYKFKAEW